MQHGGAPAGLIAREVQALAPELQVSRLTYEFLGPVPLAPVTVSAAIVRPGRRFQVAEAELVAGGRAAVRARAVLLRRGEVALPPEAIPVTTALLAPDDGALPGQWGPEGEEAFHRTGMDIRFVQGNISERGPAAAWFRLAHPFIDDAPEPPPVTRAAAAADFGNGTSRVLDFQQHLFVNTDLTVHLLRDPVGEWVLIDSTTELDPCGTGLATSRIHDARGPIGWSHQTLFVEER
jgi:hypothetical protein